MKTFIEIDKLINSALQSYRVEIVATSDKSCWRRFFVKAPDKKTAQFLAKAEKKAFLKTYYKKRAKVHVEKVY